MVIKPQDLNPRAIRLAIELLIALGIGAVGTVTGWVIGIRNRRRINRTLGRQATDADLLSLETWMEVENQEQKKGLDSLN
jgi:hypothetical protein